MRAMCDAALKGERERAIEINNRLLGLHNQLFLESNPIPVKWALWEMGLIESGIRLPLTPFNEKFHGALLDAMVSAGITVRAKAQAQAAATPAPADHAKEAA